MKTNKYGDYDPGVGKYGHLMLSLLGLVCLLTYNSHYPLLFCQMEHLDGIVEIVNKRSNSLRIENSDYRFTFDPSDEEVLQSIHRRDTVKIWFYAYEITGGQYSLLFDHGGPYFYRVTQLIVNGEMKVEYSFQFWNWLFSIFVLSWIVYNTIRFIQKTKNNETKDKAGGKNT